jgi:hypothetical protein
MTFLSLAARRPARLAAARATASLGEADQTGIDLSIN